MLFSVKNIKIVLFGIALRCCEVATECTDYICARHLVHRWLQKDNHNPKKIT